MYRNLLFGALLIPSLLGCVPPSSPAVSEGTILTYLGDPSVQTSVHYVGLDDKVVLVIWSDVVGSSRSNSASSANGVTLHGESNSEDGRQLVWGCDVSADGAGTLTLGDNTYDVGDGFIFLVATRDGSFNVQQVSRETIATSNIDRRIRELAKEREVTAFFSQSSPKNST